MLSAIFFFLSISFSGVHLLIYGMPPTLHDKEKSALRSTFAYDVARDEWIQLADMARERDECIAIFPLWQVPYHWWIPYRDAGNIVRVSVKESKTAWMSMSRN